MEIYVVKPGDTLSSIARSFGLAPDLISRYNGLYPPYDLAVGQSLAILFPSVTTVVRPGDSLYTIARRFQISPLQLLRLNPQLGGSALLTPGETLVVALQNQGTRPVEVSGYAYPFVDLRILRGILPYATYLVPFTYGIGPDSSLVDLEDQVLLTLARQYGARPLMHLSTLTETGEFSTARGADVLTSSERQQTLADAVIATMLEKGYEGLDVDFEFVGGDNAAAYAGFVGLLRDRVNALGYELITALAPKVSPDQPGVLYEGHDYPAIANNSDAVLLMTYEWGYTYGPPLAVAPLPSVRRVIDYAVTEIPPEKIYLGFPNYGYDWMLPFVSGVSRARSISNEEAVSIAVANRAEIRFDETAQSPYFYYTDRDGNTHEVWFEDARSCVAKFNLIPEYGLRGVGYWNFMRPFAASFSILTQMFDLVKPQ